MSTEAQVPPVAKPQPRWVRWAMGLAGIVVLLSGLAQVIGAFTLPSCESSQSLTTIRSIFKEKNVELEEITGAKFVSEENGQRVCSARVKTKSETADITYRISWEGWTKMIRIGEVTTVKS